MSVAPGKADSPLIVYPNRMLAFSITAQRLELISGRRTQNSQLRGSVDLEQFSECYALKRSKALAVLILE
jgi:hypothetical protein